MLSAAASRYAAFFRLPDVSRLMLAVLIARMPIGTVNLAMLLHVHVLTGSFTSAGAAVGIYLAASAIAAPLIGRRVDRRGARAVLVATGTVYPVALALIWAARPLALSTAGIFACAALAGAFTPPIAVLTRTMWRHRFEDANLRRTAYALDSVLIEFVFTAGPALIALLLAIGSPALAFGAAFGFGTLAVPVFAASPALRYLQREPQAARRLLGPLTDTKLVRVYGAIVLLAAALGLIEVGYPGFATFSGNAPLAGVLLALNAAGSAAGGLVYGGLHLTSPLEAQLRRLLALVALALALQSLVHAPSALMAFAFVAGISIAPTLTVTSLMIASYAPARHATEAFTWASAAIVSGVGAGNALGGALLQHYGAASVFAASAVTAVTAAIGARALSIPSSQASAP